MRHTGAKGIRIDGAQGPEPEDRVGDSRTSFQAPNGRAGRKWWYLQILGSPLNTPAVAPQGRLALLCGHPMHHGLQHLDFVCWPGSLLPIPWAAPLRQPCTGPQGWWLRPWVAVIGGEVGLWVWGSLRHRSDGGSGGSRGWSARRGQQWGNGQGGRLLLGALGLPQEALVALEVGRALWQQVIVGAADLPAITDNGQDAGASPWARSLDHLWSGVLRV